MAGLRVFDHCRWVAVQIRQQIHAHGSRIHACVNGRRIRPRNQRLVQERIGFYAARFVTLAVGGGITVERVVEAFKLVISDENVNAILVNIFGGIVRCDLIADGIIQAMREVTLTIPVVVRLEGTNVEIGLKMLEDSGLEVTTAEDLTDAAIKAVKAARGAD